MLFKFEGLRAHIMFILGALLMSLMLLIYMVLSTITAASIRDLEFEYVHDHMGRTMALIDENVNQVSSFAEDWAAWDETYEYIEGRNQDYIIRSAPINSLLNLQANIMVLIDSSGEVVYGVNVDLESREQGPLPGDLPGHLEKSLLTGNFAPGFLVKGIILLDEGPMIIASHPILSTDYEGPVRGNLVVGRFISPERVALLKDKLNLEVAVSRLDQPGGETFSLLNEQKPIIVNELDKNNVAGYSVIKDIYNQPAVGLAVVLSREIFNIGSNALSYLLYALLTVGLVFTCVVLLFLERNVLSRLVNLNRNVRQIAAAGDSKERLEPDVRNDELSSISNEINNMLERLHESKKAVVQSEEKFRTFVEKANDIIYSFNRDGQVTYISPNCRALGYDPDEITGSSILKHIHPEDIPKWEGLLQKTINGEKCDSRMEYRVIKKDGMWNWYSTNISLVEDTYHGGHFIGIMFDINTHKIAEETLRNSHDKLASYNERLKKEIARRQEIESKIKFMAYHDNLTGLPNRLLFADRLNQAILQAKRTGKIISVMFLDLDDFKMVNDTMGHAQGDGLLKEVAKRLSGLFRDSDTIARFGGDEFIIMVQNMANAVAVEQIAGKVMRAFQKPFILAGREYFTTASIGVAVYPDDGEEADTLVKNADFAMYKAKEKGRNKFVFCTSLMKAKVMEKMELTNCLYRALERNELRLLYQPQVSHGSGNIIGLEALLRWRHPEQGIISPREFIPIAEHTGLIVPIGEWVLRTACAQNKAWQDAGLPKLPVGVNLSVNQFQNPNLAGRVSQILRETGLDPSCLELEITENIAIKETSQIIETLQDLKSLGVSISIDDFGTEYSSLKYLKQLPIDKIKVAMPFIHGIGINEKDEAIVKTIIALARSLGLRVIAEGVETQEQLSFVTQWMCDEVQGFYYYKPMPAHEMEVLLRSIKPVMLPA